VGGIALGTGKGPTAFVAPHASRGGGLATRFWAYGAGYTRPRPGYSRCVAATYARRCAVRPSTSQGGLRAYLQGLTASYMPRHAPNSMNTCSRPAPCVEARERKVTVSPVPTCASGQYTCECALGTGYGARADADCFGPCDTDSSRGIASRQHSLGGPAHHGSRASARDGRRRPRSIRLLRGSGLDRPACSRRGRRRFYGWQPGSISDGVPLPCPARDDPTDADQHGRPVRGLSPVSGLLRCSLRG